MRGAILQALANHGRPIRLPETARALLAQVAIAEAELAQELRRSPTYAEIACHRGVREDEITSVLLRARAPLPLTLSPDESDRSSGIDRRIPRTEQGVDFDDLMSEIRQALRELPARERIIVECRFGLDGRRALSLREVGELLGVSYERVRQLEVVALKRLRCALSE